MHPVGVVAVGVVGPCVRIINVSGGYDNQTRIPAEPVGVRRERVERRRPGGRPPRVPIVAGGDGHIEDPGPIRRRDLGPRDGFHCQISMVTGVRSGRAVPRNQLHRFQTVIDIHGAITGKKGRRISRQGQPRHLRSVACIVGRAPRGFNRMKVCDGERGRQQEMAAIDARIEQADMGRAAARGRVSGAVPQVVEPLPLLIGGHGIEKLRCLLRAPQFGDAVECDNGTPHSFHGRPDQQHASLRKPQFSRSDRHVLRFGSSAECGDFYRSVPPNR